MSAFMQAILAVCLMFITLVVGLVVGFIIGRSSKALSTWKWLENNGCYTCQETYKYQNRIFD